MNIVGRSCRVGYMGLDRLLSFREFLDIFVCIVDRGRCSDFFIGVFCW